MKSVDGFNEEWYRKWHKIDADKSNYISFHQYCKLQDIIAIIAERILRQSNDSLTNHMLAVYILQGPEYEYTGSRFTRWLKKKLLPPWLIRPEILRIVLDNKYFTDILMDVAVSLTDVELADTVFNPMIQKLIKKSKESLKELMEHAAEEHKEVLDYLKDK